ncbi:MAG: aminopeptidase [Sarcina sp.]
MDFNYIIPNIVSGMEIMKDDIVILNFWGENKDLNILEDFELEILKLGAKPVKIQQSREFLKKYFVEFSLTELFNEEYFESLKNGNVVIDIFMYGPKPHQDFPLEKINLYREYLKKTFNALLQNKRLFIQVRVPTQENAIEEGIDYNIYKKVMFNAMNIDYMKLKSITEKIVKKLENKKNIEIHTQSNNILNLNIENRKWNKDDGIGDIPCGEVYIAPIEESVNGSVVIPKLKFNESLYSNVVLEFERGKLIKSSNKELIDFIKKFQDDSDKIAEFGIGLNENVTEIIGYSVIDEKCKGTVHIAIGSNKMFGGKNDASIHLDFVFTPELLKFDEEIFEFK